MTDLEQRVQNQWMVFEKILIEKIVQPDDKEAVITQTEHRIKMAAQRNVDEGWRNRIGHRGQDHYEYYVVLRFDVTRLGAKLSEEVVCMRSRLHGSTAK